MLHKQNITIELPKETKLEDFICDINGYNCIRLDGTNQTRTRLAFLVKNNHRFCQRKISYSSNTQIDQIELCLPEKDVLFISIYYRVYLDIDISGIEDEIQKNTFVLILTDINLENELEVSLLLTTMEQKFKNFL